LSGFRQFIGPLLTLILTLVVGVVGYMVIEGWNFLDALFMTVTTITTVGYGEVHPLDTAGRIFSMVLIFGGVGGVLYTFTALSEWLLATNWSEQRRAYRLSQELQRRRDHYILCGYGRVGRSVAEVLTRERVPFVIVDVNQHSLATARADGHMAIDGNAASDDILRKAGIERAKGLIAAVASDADNVYVVLSARGIRPNILIIARASSEDAVTKLERAGANHVISPYAIAGQRMAMLAVRPVSVELVESLFQAGRQELQLEELVVKEGSALSTLDVATVRQRFPDGPMIVAIRTDGRLASAPSGEYRLRPGDELVVVGSPTLLRDLNQLV
jgi:voltage-gated potassium channel